MLQVQDLSYSVGGEELLKGIDWTVMPGKRSALIGPNGTGKTTLLRIITGEIQDYSGKVTMPKGFRIGYLPQEEITVEGSTPMETALEGRQEILHMEQKIAALREELGITSGSQAHIMDQLGELEHRFEAIGGYKLESSAKTILSGLGFSNEETGQPLTRFSGGWRMRAYLAKLLVQMPDLLLLYEPTNHLDLESLEWLEQYLQSFKGGLVIVSHDRFFIDRTVQDIYELERGIIIHYPGNYQYYEEQKELMEKRLRKKWEQQQAEKKRQMRFIERYRADKIRASQTQSRIKHLEKMEDIVLPPAPKKPGFKLSVEVLSYKDVAVLRNMSFRYEKDWVLQDINLHISRGDRIALVGVNGAGKTTLTRLIAGQLTPQAGFLQLGKKTAIGYYAQHRIEALSLESTVYDEIASSVSVKQVSRIRDVLGIFQISGDAVFKKIKVLSGGEKARVSLVKILLSPVNLLIMDEPTTHLDMSSKQALEHALSQYTGTMLLISHDRYFLDRLVDRVVEIHERRIEQYTGNYSAYLEKREPRSLLSKVRDDPPPVSQKKKEKEQKRLEAEARQAVSKKRNRLTRKIENLELTITDLEKEKSETEMRLVQPEVHKNSEQIVNLQKRHARIKKDLDDLYKQWEEARNDLEDLLSGIT